MEGRLIKEEEKGRLGVSWDKDASFPKGQGESFREKNCSQPSVPLQSLAPISKEDQTSSYSLQGPEHWVRLPLKELPVLLIKMANLTHHQINKGTLHCHSTEGLPFINSLLGSVLREPLPYLMTGAPLSWAHQELFPGGTPTWGWAWKLFWGDVSKCASLKAKTTQECKCCWVGWQVLWF